MGRLFFHIIGSFAEFERELIIERIHAGLSKARAKGIVLGRPAVVKDVGERILALRAEGISLRQIAQREGLSPAGVLKIIRRYASSQVKTTSELG